MLKGMLIITGHLKLMADLKYSHAQFSHLVKKGCREKEATESGDFSLPLWQCRRRVRKGQGGDLWYCSVYSTLLKNIRCFTNRTNSHSGPSTCINECRVPELMDLTSPVTRKVLRLQICSTEVQCQRVPVWSHVQREKVQQFIDGNAFYVLQSASGEGNRVRQAGGG